jgi:hypothetical protein
MNYTQLIKDIKSGCFTLYEGHLIPRHEVQVLAALLLREDLRVGYAFVPEERIISSPALRHSSTTANRVELDFYQFEGQWMDRLNLGAQVTAKLGHYPGAAAFAPLSLYEYWEDVGDDGHVQYRFMGYVAHKTHSSIDSVYALQTKVNQYEAAQRLASRGAQ